MLYGDRVIRVLVEPRGDERAGRSHGGPLTCQIVQGVLDDLACHAAPGEAVLGLGVIHDDDVVLLRVVRKPCQFAVDVGLVTGLFCVSGHSDIAHGGGNQFSWRVVPPRMSLTAIGGVRRRPGIRRSGSEALVDRAAQQSWLMAVPR